MEFDVLVSRRGRDNPDVSGQFVHVEPIEGATRRDTHLADDKRMLPDGERVYDAQPDRRADEPGCGQLDCGSRIDL